MTDKQETGHLMEVFKSDLIDLRVSSNVYDASDDVKQAGVEILSGSIESQLHDLEMKLCVHINDHSFLWTGCEEGEDVLFTVAKSRLNEIMPGCNAIIDEFNECVIETYKQYQHVLSPHFTESQWIAQNTLTVSKQEIEQ